MANRHPKGNKNWMKGFSCRARDKSETDAHQVRGLRTTPSGEFYATKKEKNNNQRNGLDFGQR